MSQDVLRGAVPEDSEGVKLLDQAIEAAQQKGLQGTETALEGVREYIVQGITHDWLGVMDDDTLFDELTFYVHAEDENAFREIRAARKWLHDHYRLLLWDRMEQQQTR
jgi:hypothetical protein